MDTVVKIKGTKTGPGFTSDFYYTKIDLLSPIPATGKLQMEITDPVTGKKAKGYRLITDDNGAHSILDCKTGLIGNVIQKENAYYVHLQPGHNLTEQKQHGLESRMRNWYFYTHIKANK